MAITEKPNVYTMDTGNTRRKPGCRPGQKHAGQFKAGFDERRHLEGPTKVKMEFRVAIAESAEQAVRVLDQILADDTAPTRERRAAAELVLSHAVGLPVNRVVMATVDSGGTPAQAMSLDQLMSQAQRLLKDDVPRGTMPEDVIDEQ